MAKTGQADTGKVQEAIVAKFGAPDSPYQVLWATTFLTIVALYTQAGTNCGASSQQVRPRIISS